MPRLDELASDPSYLHLPEGELWVSTPITPLRGARLFTWNEEVAALLGLDPGLASTTDGRADLAARLNGERPLPWATPTATVYAGHQFGAWVPRLGDGRALLLGEVTGPDGRRFEVQLKGSGPTPFSRFGDGRAVLRSVVREYLVGEALEGLGIPSQRALAIVASDTPVRRETLETGAMLVRVASTHVRFGTFEWAASRGKPALVARLAEHVIAHDYPHLVGAQDRHRRLLAEVTARTARLAAQWLAQGFVHGVLNTDNMSIAGFTLDHGPFAFVEAFDPLFCPNHTDHAGRYALERQPEVGLWNLSALAHALESLVPRADAAEVLQGYAPEFGRTWTDLMRRKLGLATWRGEEDELLVHGLLELLAAAKADYPATLRALGAHDFASPAPARALVGPCHEPALDAWLARWRARLAADGVDDAARRRTMDAVNPRVVLRAHLAQRAVELAQQGDASETERLLAALRRPFADDTPDEYAAPAPAGAAPLELSCSS